MTDDESGDDDRDGLTSEVNRQKTGEADRMNLEGECKDEVMHN